MVADVLGLNGFTAKAAIVHVRCKTQNFGFEGVIC